MSDARIRWGILGTGSIAHKFAEALAILPEADLVAVGSRRQKTADAFAKAHTIRHAHGSYEALAADPEVDAVYVGTPHPMHRDNAMLCLTHDKAVLCEKPFAMNTRDAEAMIALARSRQRFLMEAMWTHFFPAMGEIRRLIAKGRIGEVRMVKADFCFRSRWKPEGRLLNPELGGGALLDIGVYTVSLARMIYGREPTSVHSVAALGKTGVDEQTGILLGYDDGALGVLTCAVRTTTPHEALIAGTEGWIRIPHPFWQPDRFTLNIDGKEKERTFERLGNGYCWEAQEVMTCLRKNRLESNVMPHAKTLGVMQTMDRIQAQWGALK